MNAYQAGQKLLCGGYSSYTPTGSDYFKRAGRWHKAPEYGDIVYFYSSSKKRIGHVGIVSNVYPDSKLFDAIEGNTSDSHYDENGGCVARHQYSYAAVGGTNRVAGFGRPAYASDTCAPESLVSAAMKELGYEEKATAAYLDDKHANVGSNNYTKYGAWYGLNPAQWCQLFVSWCAYTACSARKNAGWEQGGTAHDAYWYYRDTDGNFVRNAWKCIDGRWYAFDGSGRAICDQWFLSEGSWYYMGKDCAMLSSQWYCDEKTGNWYYLAASGAMAADAYIHDRKTGKYSYVDADGIWREEKDTDTPLPGIEVIEA